MIVSLLSTLKGFVMESLLLLIPLVCPLAMAAMGLGAWFWAKVRAVPSATREGEA
jgi:hypothetical protein